MRSFSFIWLVATLLVAAACGTEPGGETSPAVDTASVAPETTSVGADTAAADGQSAAAASYRRDATAVFAEFGDIERELPLLSSGDLAVIFADSARGLAVYARYEGDRAAIVAINRGDEAHSLRAELPERLRSMYEVAATTQREGYRVQQDATALLLELPERFGLVLTNEPAD